MYTVFRECSEEVDGASAVQCSESSNHKGKSSRTCFQFVSVTSLSTVYIILIQYFVGDNRPAGSFGRVRNLSLS